MVYLLSTILWFNYLHAPGRVAQLVERLTQEPEVPGAIPGPATYRLSFLLPLIQEGQLSVTGESMCMKYW